MLVLCLGCDENVDIQKFTIKSAATDKRHKIMATFRKVNFSMRRGNGYGQYVIEATYRGKDIKAHTTDSEAWDWLNDEGATKEEKEKHREALRHCYYKVVEAYENL